MHLWIEEDLVYTAVCQALKLVVHVAVAKAFLAGGDQHFSDMHTRVFRTLRNFPINRVKI